MQSLPSSQPPQKREAYAVVLDYLPSGKAGEAERFPLAQVVGDTFFTLLEVALKPGVQVNVGDRLYIGPEDRPHVDRIKGRVSYAELTRQAQNEVETAVRKIVQSREADFVNFLNKAGAINIRTHSLELLPGIGKKHLEELVAIREKDPFKSFADVHARIPTIGHPEDLFVKRIVEELKGLEKYYFFAKQPSREIEEREHGGGSSGYSGRYGSGGGYGNRTYSHGGPGGYGGRRY